MGKEEADYLDKGDIDHLLDRVEEEGELAGSGLAEALNGEEPPKNPGEADLAVSIWDFQRPDGIGPEDLEEILSAADRWSSIVSYQLDTLLACSAGADIISVDVLPWGELRETLPDRETAGLTRWGKAGPLLFSLPAKGLSCLREALLGQAEIDPSRITSSSGRMEKRIFCYLLETQILPAWERAWRVRGGVQPQLVHVENCVDRISAWDPRQMLAVISVEWSVGDVPGRGNVVFSWETLQRLRAEGWEEPEPAASRTGNQEMADTEWLFSLNGAGWTFEELLQLRRGEALMLPLVPGGRRRIRAQEGDYYGN